MDIPKKLLAFDIETSEQAQDDKIAPITVASTVTNDGDERAWFSDPSDSSVVGMIGKGKDETWADYSPGKRPLAPTMSKATAQSMLKYMLDMQRKGYAIAAWNGASFDLKMIGHLADDVETAGTIALSMFDPMFQILSQKGFAVGLAAVAKGLGITQAKAMDGKDAPEAWKNGEFQKVIGYVVGDSQMTVKIVEGIGKADGIRWTTKAGKNSYAPFLKFKTVAECLLDPAVNQSWQEKPLNKHQMVAWIPASARGKAKNATQTAESQSRKGADAGAKPVLLLMSGPSGAGKTVLREELARTMPEIKPVITATTRAPRKGEMNGVDYLFVSEEKFNQMVAAGEFLESADIHGYKYGSCKKNVSDMLSKGEDVVMIVDVQGAASIRKFMGDLPAKSKSKFCFADVFVMPPSVEELKKRLVARGKDDAATIEERLKNAVGEIARAKEYKYIIKNDTMDKAWDRLRSIIIAERCLN